MSIIYTVIARDGLDLADYDQATGNYKAIMMKLINKPISSNKLSCVDPNNPYVFHIQKDDPKRMVFACMTDSSYLNEKAYQFLQEIKHFFYQRFSDEEIKAATLLSLQNKFVDTLKTLIDKYAANKVDNKLQTIKTKLNTTKDVLITSTDKLIDLSDQIDMIVKQVHRVDDLATQFKGKAAQVHSEMRWRNQKCKYAALGGAGVGILLLVLFVL